MVTPPESQLPQVTLPTDPPVRFNKPVEIVHSIPDRGLTPIQARMSNVMLRHVLLHEPDEIGWYTIGMSEVRSLLEFGSRNYAPILAAAQTLLNIKYEWDVLVNEQNRRNLQKFGPGTENKTLLRASVLFPEIEVNVKTLRYQVSRPVVELLLRPEMYAALDLGMINRLRRTASIVLYEQIQRYAKLGSTRRAPWETYRNMMLGRESEHTPLMDYRRFKARVLIPAIAEIEAQHAVQIKLTEFREQGRSRIADIQFGIRCDTEYQSPHNPVNPEAIRQIGELNQLGITQYTAKAIMAEAPPQDIDAAIQFVSARMGEASKSGTPVRSPAAFMRRCLKEKWWQGTLLEQSTVSPPAQANQPMVTRKSEIDTLKDQFTLHIRLQATKDLDELPKSEKQSLFAEYNAQQELALLQVKDGRPMPKMAEAAFLSWYIKLTYGEPTDQDLLMFAAKRFHEVSHL